MIDIVKLLDWVDKQNLHWPSSINSLRSLSQLLSILPIACSMQRLRCVSARLPPEHCFISVRNRSTLPLLRLLRSPHRSYSSIPSSTSNSSKLKTVMMDDQIKQHYLADSPPTVVKLEVKSHFDKLQDDKLRKYAHYISRSVPSN